MDLDGKSGVNGAEPIRSEMCLGQSQGAAATAKPDRPVGKR